MDTRPRWGGRSAAGGTPAMRSLIPLLGLAAALAVATALVAGAVFGPEVAEAGFGLAGGR